MGELMTLEIETYQVILFELSFILTSPDFSSVKRKKGLVDYDTAIDTIVRIAIGLFSFVDMF